MDKAINELENIDLSGLEMQRMSGVNNVVAYHELNNYRSINQLLGQDGIVIILYEMRENFGHWCCMWRLNTNTLYFFDPYGLKMDTEIKYAHYNIRLGSIPHLTYLVNLGGYTVVNNTTQMQEFKHQVNTCGRHVVQRILWKNLSNENYVNMFLNQKLKPDQYVSLLTMNL